MSATELPPNPSTNPPKYIYRIVTRESWADTYEKDGKYCGSPLDQKDGFIHISDKAAVARTAELYYANEKDIVLVQLDVAAMLPAGKLIWDWVPSRNTYFPHWYDLVNGFNKSFVHAVIPIKYDEESKKHVIPELQ